MKKNFMYAMMSTIVLTGAVNLTACSSGDEIVDNPDYNPETNTVKTQFAISIPNVGNNSATRMTAENVQATGNFLGIKDFKLLSFTSKADGIGSTGGTLIDLPSISSFTTDLTTTTSNYDHAQLFTDIEINTGTKSFLLYGVSGSTTKPANESAPTETEIAGMFSNGTIITPTVWTVAPIGFTFSLRSIATTTADAKANALVAYINAIAGASGWKESTGTLKTLFDNFTSLHAGSSASVQAAVQGLYHSVFSKSDAVSEAIKTAIKTDTYASDTKDDGTLTFTDAINGYPANINLPDGAAYIAWSDTKQASVATGAGTINTFNQTTSLDKYTFPAALYYRTKSNIKTSNVFEKQYYVNTNSWSDILNKYTSGEEVTTATKSIAIENPLQYAVGRLDVKVKLGDVTVYDRNGDAVVLDANGLKLTGVIVGGQSAVNCDFEPTGTSDRVIYDKVADNTMVTNNEPSAIQNHTLVFETPSTGENQKVRIALEFENTGETFQGADGIVPAGCKFYLIAELDPTKTSDIKTGTARDKVFEQDYTTTVELTISQGSNSAGNNQGLGNAYNTIPDLRSKGMELGMSVDLKWQPGITFQVNI